MKILITEKQSKNLFDKKIKCRCGHSWSEENKDKHKYLCHICGWDQKEEVYNNKELFNFRKKYKK